MPEVTGERAVFVKLSPEDLARVEDGGLRVECPHTGETIVFAAGLCDRTVTCECCGQEVEADITPSARSLAKRLKDGGTVMWTTVHTEEDITIVARGNNDVKPSAGWR